MSMRLDIITPDKTFYSDRVDWVRVPGTKGSFAMLKGHLPIVSTLDEGVIKVVKQGQARYFKIEGKSIVEQNENHVTILTSSIEETIPYYKGK